MLTIKITTENSPCPMKPIVWIWIMRIFNEKIISFKMPQQKWKVQKKMQTKESQAQQCRNWRKIDKVIWRVENRKRAQNKVLITPLACANDIMLFPFFHFTAKCTLSVFFRIYVIYCTFIALHLPLCFTWDFFYILSVVVSHFTTGMKLFF